MYSKPLINSQEKKICLDNLQRKNTLSTDTVQVNKQKNPQQGNYIKSTDLHHVTSYHFSLIVQLLGTVRVRKGDKWNGKQREEPGGWGICNTRSGKGEQPARWWPRPDLQDWGGGLTPASNQLSFQEKGTELFRVYGNKGSPTAPMRKPLCSSDISIVYLGNLKFPN